jgi:SPP1 gp7 family putative phage head morphogenesis protein
VKNSDYWKIRFAQLEEAQNKKGADAYAEIEKIYRQAQKEIEGKINTWYGRFAANNGISMTEAKKMLFGADLKEFKWDVNDYIRYGEENAVSQAWMKELENASARFHITRFEALKLQVQQSMEQAFGNQLDCVDAAMRRIYQDGYYHTAYELQKGFGIGWDIAGFDQKHLEKVIVKPWAVDGKNFSERIWGNKQKLISEIHNELTQNVILGRDPQKAIDAIARKMKTSKYNAGRLVMTEEAYFSSLAQRDCFHALDVEQYEIVAVLDSRTSEICQEMDGKVFPTKDFKAGVTAPPFHVFCRSTTVPYFEEDFGTIGQRVATGKDGKMYYVPADMGYEKWKEVFVDGGDKSGLQEISSDDKIEVGEEERYALNRYLSSESYILNDKLRKGMELTDEEKKWVRDLDSILDKMPEYKGTVYRSVSDFGIENVEKFINSHVTDSEFRSSAYVSSSERVYDESFPIQYVIESKHGKDIRTYNQGEQEVLFKRDSVFYVTKVENNIIYLEEEE